jgi:sugar lactone lactonase YvrE
VTPFDDRICALGEGPLWQPETQTLFWFDILGKRLLSRRHDKTRVWQFDRHFSAAGRVDANTLILASQDALWRFDVASGDMAQICPLEADNPVTRSNDGRADPWGGFWIGSMGKQMEKGAGAIYRFYRGELRQLVDDITVSNAICFAPGRSVGYYADTPTRQIMQVALDADTGWPLGAPQIFADLRDARLNPDGAVSDAQGNLWVACWGAGCVICLDRSGEERARIEVPARQPSCPAFGGPDLRDLYITSAAQSLNGDALQNQPLNGATFVIKDVAQGLPEPFVIL